ncbi:MAG TPA: tetratricopeptide repeat protein [Polyangiales bacterium]|jgi:tetratricopeptide (TPR) repeat protein
MRNEVFGLAVFVCALAGCGNKSAGSEHIRRGDALLSESKVQKAIGEYELALQTPARDEALFRLAGAYETAGEFGQAEKYLKEASQKLPTDPGLRLSNARILAATGRVREAFDEAFGLAQIAPGNAEAAVMSAAFASTRDQQRRAADKLAAWQEREARRTGEKPSAETLVPLALLYEKLGDPERAKTLRSNADRVGVKDLALALSLANTYFGMHQLLPAEELFELAAKHAPKRPATWLRLAAVQAGLREWSAASGSLDHLEPRLRADPETRLIEAQIRLGLSQPSAAEALLAPLLAHPSRDADGRHDASRAQYWLGEARVAQHDSAGAENAFKAALQIEPNFDAAQLALAQLYLSIGSSARAIELLKKLTSQAPQTGEAYRWLGSALLAAHDPKAATQAFERYRELSPESAEGQYLVASALAAQGKLDDARKQLEISLALNPNWTEALRLLVSLLVQQGQPGEAENRLQIELARRGRNAELLTMFGDLLFEQRKDHPEKIEEAEHAYREALEADGTYTQAWLGLGELYTESDRTGPALLAYQAAIPHASAPGELWLRIAQLHVRHGDGTEAREAYEQVLARDPNSVLALNNLAYVYADLLNDPAHALELAERARQLAPDAANVADTYAWVLWQQAGSSEALALLEDAAKRLPGSAEAQYHLGVALVKQGQKREGRAALSRALDLSATFPGADAARLVLARK